MAKNRRQQQALVDFETVFVLLLKCVLTRQDRVVWHQAGDDRSCIADQMFDAG